MTVATAVGTAVPVGPAVAGTVSRRRYGSTTGVDADVPSVLGVALGCGVGTGVGGTVGDPAMVE
jgi:hypothetical protein